MRVSHSLVRAAAAGAALLGVIGCSDSNAGPTPPALKGVVVGAAGFSPAALIVAERDSVVWTWNTGGVPHNVTFENGPSSATQAAGLYGRSFLAKGIYRYRCTLHSSDFTAGMVGTVDVRTGSGAYEVR